MPSMAEASLASTAASKMCENFITDYVCKTAIKRLVLLSSRIMFLHSIGTEARNEGEDVEDDNGNTGQ